MTYTNFCDRITELRKARYTTQTALARKLNVTRKAITDWESNKVLPSFDSIIALAYAFDVSADYILGMTDDPTPHTK